MQWLTVFIFYIIIFTAVNPKPINKHSLKHNKKKHTKLHEKIRSKTFGIKSNIDVFKLLTQLGYNRCKGLSVPKPSGHNGSLCQSSLESMLAAFQTAYHLPITKKLDAATLKLINTPRCGLTDSSPSFTDRSKLWPTNRTLKWKLKHDHFFYNSRKTRHHIQQAFDDWGSHSGLTFRQETGDEDVDFNLAFEYGNHSDGYPFDGRGGTLAHAFLPWKSDSGHIHFDSTEKWSHMYDGMGHNLRLVATHEIGHSLGLEHSMDSNSIMFPFYQVILPNKMLPKPDQDSIQALYGKKQNALSTLHPTTYISSKTTKRTTTTTEEEEIKWKQQGITIAGGYGDGNQLNHPWGISIDNEKTIYIADWGNHRIAQWRFNEKKGQLIAGGNGKGNRNRNDQLNLPTDIIVDKQKNSLIICDRGNRRVIRWSSQNKINQQILISDIYCVGLKMDKNGSIYVSDQEKNEIRRWKEGDKDGIIVAGGNGPGSHYNQFNVPTFIVVDEDYSLYVSDMNNHRVMKWTKDAREGIVVAGGNGLGNSLKQFSYPHGVVVHHSGQIYVADCSNHRIMRWYEGSSEGSVVVGGNGQGEESNQLSLPTGLSFDVEDNLYVSDFSNNRIQKFELDFD